MIRVRAEQGRAVTGWRWAISIFTFSRCSHPGGAEFMISGLDGYTPALTANHASLHPQLQSAHPIQQARPTYQQFDRTGQKPPLRHLKKRPRTADVAGLAGSPTFVVVQQPVL